MVEDFRKILSQEGFAAPENVHDQPAPSGIPIESGNLLGRQFVVVIAPPEARLAAAIASPGDEVGKNKRMVREKAGFHNPP
jgi:hypothetical protein